MAKHGKLLTLCTVAVGVAVLGAAGSLGKDWILEEWCIRRLSSDDDANVKAAVRRLGELRSARAAPFLVPRLWKWTEEGKGGLIPEYYEVELNGQNLLMKDYAVIQGTWTFEHDIKDALIRIGTQAVPHLVDALKDGEACHSAVVWALGEMGSMAKAAVPDLERCQGTKDLGLKAWVDEALTKIQAP